MGKEKYDQGWKNALGEYAVPYRYYHPLCSAFLSIAFCRVGGCVGGDSKIIRQRRSWKRCCQQRGRKEVQEGNKAEEKMEARKGRKVKKMKNVIMAVVTMVKSL